MEKFELQFPLARPHVGFPLANGNFGALVWGNDTLNFTVNQCDVWDHRGGGRLSAERGSEPVITGGKRDFIIK